MGKLLDTIQAKLDDLNQRAQEKAPNYKEDPNAALDYIKRRNAIEYERTETGKKLVQALRKLPKARQDEFYRRCFQRTAQNGFTKAQYDNHMDPNTNNGKTQTGWMLRDKTFGQSWQRNIEVLEEFIGPEEVDALLEEIEQTVAPTHPEYPEEKKLVYPYENQIEEMKNSLDPFRPDSILDREILDQVNEELAYVSDEMREQIDKIDGSISGVTGYQTMVNTASYDMQNRFIRQDLEGGKYKDKFPTLKSSQASAGHFYAMNDVELSENGPFKQEDLDEIKKVRPNISDGLKNDIISVTDKLEGLGEENFKNEYSAKKDLNSDDKWFYASEQAYKLYAYSPLDKARNKLAAAVESKDMLRIREEHEKYKETKKAYDEMLKTVKKHPTGLSAGNINSTRPMANNAANPLPLEHMEDFVGHSQLNGLYCLYALGKNTNSTPAQLLENPIKVMSDAGEQYTQENGLNSRQTTGEKLFWGLSESTCDNFSRPWTAHTGQLCTRAFDNIACMAEDPQEQNRIAEGHGNFTDAYVKASNDVARKNHQQVGKAPQDMQAEEKGQVWKNNPLPM